MRIVQKVHTDEKIHSSKTAALALIYRSIEPVLIMCRIVGLLPIIHIKEKDEIALQLSDKDWMYFAVYFVVYFWLLMYNVEIVINEEITLFISKFFQLLFVLMLTLTMCAGIILGFLKRSIVRDGLASIAEVDCFFKLANLKIDYFAMKKRTLKILLIVLGIFSLRTITFFLIPEIAFIQHVLLIVLPLLKFVLLFEYSVFVILISDRFRDINSAIRAYGESKLVNSEKARSVAEKLYILCRSHFRLCNVAHMLNATFGFQLLICAAMIILNFLAQCYFLYILCTREAIEGTTIKALAIFLWFCGEIIELFLTLNSCTGACDNANDISIALHEIQNTVENSEIESHIQIYSIQMLHQKINFSALGFFEMDFSLFYAMVGTVLTFLVIVVQYDQASQAVPTTTATDLQLYDNLTTFGPITTDHY